jgi:putative membrane-bound dehydrogenase-like protein
MVGICSFGSARISLAEENGLRIEWGYQQSMDRFFSEGVAAGDINGDEIPDLVVGPFWIEGPELKTRHRIQAGDAVDPHGYAPHFFSFTQDFNGDGRTDILHIGFPGQAAYWLENPGPQETMWARHEVLDKVDNESPTFADLTGDGQRELICSRGGVFGYSTPVASDPQAAWTFHPISPPDVAGGQFTHGLGYGDIDGDGRNDLLEKNGWWRQPESLEGDPVWERKPFQFSGPGGSQMFAHDFDGDGDADVVTSLAAHGYGVAWYEQIERDGQIDFVQHLIAGAKRTDSEFGTVFSQPHALAIADLDSDGLMDIVTGKRPWAHGPHGDAEPNAAPVLYWFRCSRGEDGVTRFIPQLISDQSGVGVDLLVTDVNRDGLPDVVAANKRGLFIHRQSREAIDPVTAARLKTPLPSDAAVPLPPFQRPSEGLEPEAAAAQFTVPNGFTVDLVAGEPNLHQPVAFCFDSRGRIWVAEAHTYPQRAAEGQGRDVIRILEDADGDGSFESRKTFATGLNLVSGLEVGFGGVYVGAAPQLLFIPDADGDDVPDGPAKILLDGFGYQDTHETINTFTWGPDGWLYGCQGVFTQSLIGAPGTPADHRIPFNAGMWRYHPVRHQFEVFAAGTSNPWGIAFNDLGQAFVTACVIPHAYHMIQGGRYQRQAGQHFNPYTFDDIKTIADHAHYAGNIADHAWWGRNEAVEDDATSAAGGGHAHCGALIYQGDNWPVAYRGALLMHNIHGNRINADILRADGTGYVASHSRDLAFANDPWFRGIGMQLGPDGALYLIDWYDANACHRNSPEIWDRTNGRMYRVRFGEYQPRPVDLEAASADQLFDLLTHENEWQVRMARLQLAMRAASGAQLENVRQRLLGTVSDATTTTPHRLNYLWAAHGIRPIEAEEAVDLLRHGDAMVRAWTIQLVCERGRPSDAVMQMLAAMTQDERALEVRLYLASALDRLAAANANDATLWAMAEGLAGHGDSQFDQNLPLMVWYAVEPLVAADPQRAMRLAASTRIPLVQRFLYRRAASDPSLVDELVTAMAGEADDERMKTMIAELVAASPKLGKITMPAAWPKIVSRAAKFEDEGVRRSIQSLSVSFGDSSIFPLLRSTVTDPTADEAVRREALETLARGADPQLESVAIAALDDPRLATTALPLLARFDSKKIPQLILDRYESWDPSMRRAALDTLASRPSHAAALMEAIADQRIARTELSAVHAGKIRQLGDESLDQELERLWGRVGDTPDDIAKKIVAMREVYTPTVLAAANPHRGRALFAKSCGQCHKLFGEGSDIGPDLTGANRGSIDYLLENILAPNAIVGKDYQAVAVLTLDGRVITGLLREQSDAAIVLHDAEKLITIPRSTIDTISETVRSVMPEGILNPMSNEEIGDLLAYLQSTSQVMAAGTVPDFDRGAIPGAIEGESITEASATRGKATNQPMGGFPAGQWSGNDQLWWTGGKPGDTLTLPIAVNEPGTYEIVVAMTKAPDYAIVAAGVDDHTMAESIDLFEAGRVISTGPVSLGTIELGAGRHDVKFTITGANPKAVPQFMLGIDYLFLSKQ